ncbi:hypothetical protein DYE20_03320 [[Mycobacterium] chelonae subsp. gwanakae]|nr:hypothetical protein DYE20_03320 [[Mycobacterium] chelonae subsp. gwanakae]
MVPDAIIRSRFERLAHSNLSGLPDSMPIPPCAMAARPLARDMLCGGPAVRHTAGMFLTAVSALLPTARAVTDEEVRAVPKWRGIAEYPGATPVDMAVEVGRSAVVHGGRALSEFDWVIHAGSGYQGARTWPVHHAIQHAVLGDRGNALEVRQYCAGGLTSWVLAADICKPGRSVLCTAADNWSWTDRFAVSREIAGEPFADVASAGVLSASSGFARVIGAGSSSRPAHAEAWQASGRFWEQMDKDEFCQVYANAQSKWDTKSSRETVEMIAEAIADAIARAGLSPTEVTLFVTPSSYRGEPYRYLAGRFGIPWNEYLHQFHLEHGYLSVSGQACAIVHSASAGLLTDGANILVVATEYNVSCTAMVIRIDRNPQIVVSDSVITVY